MALSVISVLKLGYVDQLTANFFSQYANYKTFKVASRPTLINIFLMKEAR